MRCDKRTSRGNSAVMDCTDHRTVLNGVSVMAAFSMVGCGGGAEDTAIELSPAEQLVERSIAFHDPDSIWVRKRLHIAWYGTSGDGEERVNVQLVLDPGQSKFGLSGRYRGSTIEYETDGSSWKATVDGTDELDQETMERMRLQREDGLFWRSYYGFLAGLPMKLRDPGTRIESAITRTTFNDRDVVSIRVEYDAEVGNDTWYFYFDPETAQLMGCRFYHDETVNDGEYIIFEDLTEVDGLRIPRHRRWFVNADNRFLGADEVRSIELSS